MKKIIIIGGGTFNHIRNHLSLAAPAFGTAAKYLHELLPASKLFLTKMAGGESLNTNEDVSSFVDKLIEDTSVGTIIMSAAICDFNSEYINDIPNGSHAQRLSTDNGGIRLNLFPADKIISRIREKRPDIFLVGFKTTTKYSEEGQYYKALKFMKKTKCNLVLANDTITRRNMVLVPEEAKYFVSKNRNFTLNGLASLIRARHYLTYKRTNFTHKNNVDISQTPKTFQEVLNFLIDNGGYRSDNGNGFTPGHFCFKVNDNTFYSSQRKQNHNNVFKKGLTLVSLNQDGQVNAYGTHKPSVGATSQHMLFKQYPEYDCIIHTHNPIQDNSDINTIPQFYYQCGSIECGKNTLSGMSFKDDIGSIYLEKHGPNIMFKSTDDPQRIINFIANNFKLGFKVN